MLVAGDKLFKEAQTDWTNLKNGTSNTIYNISISVYQSGYKKRQALMHVDSVTQTILNPTIKLNFYKTDFADNSLTDAEIEVTKKENVSSISGTLTKSGGNNGYFGQLEIKPTTNTGEFKINLKETKTSKNHLGLPGEEVLTVKYDTTSGEVSSITAKNYSSYFNTDSGSVGIIIVKNKTIPPLKMDIKKTVDGGTIEDKFIFNVKYEQQGLELVIKTITLGKTSSGVKTEGIASWQPGNSNNIKVTISETSNDENYEAAGSFWVWYTYDSTNEVWKIKPKSDKDSSPDIGGDFDDLINYKAETGYKRVVNSKLRTKDYKTYEMTVNNHYNPPVRLRFYKKDITGNSLSGAKMTIKKASSDSNIKKIEYADSEYTDSDLVLISNSNGTKNGVFEREVGNNLYTVKIIPDDNSKGYIKLDITELVAPNGYNKLKNGEKVTLTVKFDKNGIVESTSVDPSEYNRLLGLNKIWTSDSTGVKYGIIWMKNDSRIIKGTKLYKYDITGKYAVPGAKFTAEFDNVDSVTIKNTTHNATNGKVTVTGLVSDANGLIADIQQIKAKENVDTVHMTVTETDTVSGFDILPKDKPAKFVFKYEKYNNKKVTDVGGEWKLYEAEDNQLPQEFFKIENDKELKLKLKDDYKIDNLTIVKTDSVDTKENVKGAKFDLTLENVKSIKGYSTGSSDTLTITGVTTDEKGNIVLEDVVIKDISQPVKITIVETEAPEGYKKIDGEMYVYITKTDLKNDKYLIKRDKQTSVLEDEFKAGEETVEGNTISLGINDIPALQELDLIKKDSQDGEKELSDAEFKLTFKNIKYYYINGTKYTDATKDGVKISDGIEKILPDDINQPMTITLVETKAPVGYKRIEGTITLNIKYEDNEQRYSIEATSTGKISEDKEFNASDDRRIENGKKAYVTMKDIPIINIGGIVWEDTQTGNKQISGPDGKLNNGETGISGIGVEIYNEKDERVYQDIYGDELVDTTAGNGQEFSYKLNNGNSDTISLNAGEYIFPNLEKGEYYVKFLYDGINYETTKISNNIYESTSPEKESKVTEEGRDAFNARFKTISPGQSNDGTKLGYDYNEAEKTSKLQVGIKGENPANGNEFDFQMKAKSENYLRSGDADWIKVWTEEGKINREHYVQDVNCGLIKKYFDLALGTDVKSARVTINGKEATYDYAKIMKGGLENLDLNEITQNKSSETDGIEYTLYLYNSDYNFRIEDYKTDMTPGVKDTTSDSDHSVISDPINKNESDELQVYVTYSIVLKNQSKQSGTVNKFVYYYDSKYTPYEITSTDRYNVEIEEVGKITFTSNSDGLSVNESDEYRKEIDITFRINKDSNGYVLKGEFSNAGEIIEYSTPEGGLIDYDSAPGNAEFGLGEQKTIAGHYEDDCDEAKGLEISIKDEVRETIGTVFEDINKDGVNNDSKPVNDVIVQLIELKTIKGKYYEYIWQQTHSGSNEVLTTTRYGYDPASKYNSNATGDGVYQFKDFIPGNYIIRFIYGDGTSEDVKLYNGQDYQSTKDAHYKDENYNSANYSEGSSIAVDNEARRLEVMSYSTIIDNAKATALANKTQEMLDATWMCAESSNINVGVEESTKLSNMNFGLIVRPENKLLLEKHITALKITPQGTGVQPIVDAKLDIDKILDKDNVSTEDAEGVKEELKIIKSTRTERGFWQVETDIEELAQGAKVELEYTYVIKNVGDKDYLSAYVVQEYKDNIGKDVTGNGEDDYAEYLKEASKTAKSNIKGKRNNYGKYLGVHYYTGNVDPEYDAEVPSRVNAIEDNLNNNLKLVDSVEGLDFKKTNTTNVSKIVYTVDKTGENESIETVIGNIEQFKELKVGERDTLKTVKLETILSASSREISYPTYIGEIIKYTNAAGRKDMASIPGNLGYVNSNDNEMTMENSNEPDEFWGERIMVSKPTGENKQAPVQIIVIAISSVAVIGVGIILIKKFVLKK